MLNVALAINLVLVMLYLLIFKEVRWLGNSPGIFCGLVVSTYCLLRFTIARHYIRPTMVVHCLLLCGYAIPLIAMVIAVMGTMDGGNGLGAGILVVVSFVPASILLMIGLLILAIGVIRSIGTNRQ
jgi:hypothetical protein